MPEIRINNHRALLIVLKCQAFFLLEVQRVHFYVGHVETLNIEKKTNYLLRRGYKKNIHTKCARSMCKYLFESLTLFHRKTIKRQVHKTFKEIYKLGNTKPITHTTWWNQLLQYRKWSLLQKPFYVKFEKSTSR